MYYIRNQTPISSFGFVLEKSNNKLVLTSPCRSSLITCSYSRVRQVDPHYLQYCGFAGGVVHCQR